MKKNIVTQIPQAKSQYVEFKRSIDNPEKMAGEIVAFANSDGGVIYWAYVQFRGSEFHTRNSRSWQLQEQRRAKAQR